MAVYGIDLGTTYSCIARCDENGNAVPVDLKKLSGGKKFVPSVVSFDDKTGQPTVGVSAKRRLISKPNCTKAFVKREMDRGFCEVPIMVAGKQRKLSPVEASACILYALVRDANILEQGAGHQPIHQAVITIPAKFNEAQRARTKLAAEMAGIEVLGLLQEPTAAAVAYDIPAGQTVLVFDLGGGTLDVSIVTNDRGEYKVLGTPAGDGKLGGMDWDEMLLKLCYQKAGKKIDNSAKAWNKLMQNAEEMKQDLSINDYAVDDDFGDFVEEEEIEIERSEFEVACKSLLDRCVAVVDKAIANAKAQKPNMKIDFFLTVGGSSVMPMIRKTLAKKYGAEYGKGKSEYDWLRIKDPDTAIAIGAAKWANMLSKSDHSAAIAESNLKAIEDKATHSYGIKGYRKKINKSCINNVVKASDPIVCHHHFDVSFQESAQNLTLTIYENDSNSDYAEVSESKKIKDFSIDMGSTKQKNTHVNLDINRDENGLISITVECDGYKKTVEANPSQELIDDETRKNIEHSISLMK